MSETTRGYLQSVPDVRTVGYVLFPSCAWRSFRLTYHKRQIIDTTVVEPSRRQTATRIVLTMVHFPSSLDLLTLVLI